MSDSIYLSDKLLQDVHQVLLANDEQSKDAGVSLQYLAAVLGILLARFPKPHEQKEELMEQLIAFIKQVYADNCLQSSQQAPPPPAAAQEAFGVWRPGDA